MLELWLNLLLLRFQPTIIAYDILLTILHYNSVCSKEDIQLIFDTYYHSLDGF